MKLNERNIFLDIETIPNPAMEKFMPAVEPAGNLKDPEKIAADIEKKKAAQIEDMALSPLYGRVAIIGMKFDGAMHQKNIGATHTDDAEREVIGNFFSFLNDVDNHAIVTYNGKHFDIPFIYKRAMMLGITLEKWRTVVPLPHYTKRYSTFPHCDLAEVFGDGMKILKFDTVCMAVLGKRKYEFDVKTIAERLNLGGEHAQKACEYNAKDVLLLQELYNRCANVLF